MNLKKTLECIVNRLDTKKRSGVVISIFLNLVLLIIMMINYTRAEFFYSSSTMESVMKDAANATVVIVVFNLLAAILVDFILKNESLFCYYAAACITVSIVVTVFVQSSLSLHISECVKEILSNVAIFWGVALGGRLLLFLIFAILNSPKKRLIINFVISCLIIIGCILCYIYRDQKAESLKVLGKSIATVFFPLILFEYIIIKDVRNYGLGGNRKKVNWLLIISPILAMIVTIGVLCVSSEFGVVLICFMSICAFTFIMTTNDLNCNKVLKTLCALGMVLAVVVFIVAAHKGYPNINLSADEVAQLPFKENFETKIAQRWYKRYEDVGQIGCAKRMISESGFFGNVKFNSLYAAMYEYVFACTLKYMGYISGIILFVLLMLSIIHYDCDYNHVDELVNSSRNLFFMLVVVMTCYLWLSNLSILPLGGVNAPFTSVMSKTNSIVNGFILSVLLTPKSACQRCNDIISNKSWKNIRFGKYGRSFKDMYDTDDI